MSETIEIWGDNTPLFEITTIQIRSDEVERILEWRL